MEFNILTLIYLVASVTFIIGLKMLASPASARRGNLIAAAGMTLAIFGTIFLYKNDEGVKLGNYGWIFGGLVIGTIIGTLGAKKVKMTAMPEMVSMFNGMGGACAALISIVEFNHLLPKGWTMYPPLSNLGPGHPAIDIPTGPLFIILAGLIIGSVSFAGSMMAWGKLNGTIKDFSFKGQHLVNIALLTVIIAAGGYLVYRSISPTELPADPSAFVAEINNYKIIFYSVLTLSLLYGIMFVMPIGGADMPVVISL